MDYEAYKQKYFVQPRPEPRFTFTGMFGVTLFYQDFQEAVAYFSSVLGPPAYAEGEGTRGWEVGGGWLTLLKGKQGNPRNLEVTFVLETPAEAERLQAALLAAGGSGETPSDQLMYEPVRFCAATDPFGVDILAISPLEAG